MTAAEGAGANLPTRVGQYMDARGDYWRIDEDGKGLYCVEYPHEKAENWAPFTQVYALSDEERTLIVEALKIADG